MRQLCSMLVPYSTVWPSLLSAYLRSSPRKENFTLPLAKQKFILVFPHMLISPQREAHFWSVRDLRRQRRGQRDGETQIGSGGLATHVASFQLKQTSRTVLDQDFHCSKHDSTRTAVKRLPYRSNAGGKPGSICLPVVQH